MYYKIVSLRDTINHFIKATFSSKVNTQKTSNSGDETPKTFEKQREERLQNLHKHARNISSSMHSHH